MRLTGGGIHPCNLSTPWINYKDNLDLKADGRRMKSGLRLEEG
jgi:hypothetical protein